MAIPGWSLTSYLKSLHAGGMSWEATYWHVWAACQVFQADTVTLSALEVDRYKVKEEGILISRGPPAGVGDDGEQTGSDEGGELDHLRFSLDQSSGVKGSGHQILLRATHFTEPSPNPYITPTLNPLRPPQIPDVEIFHLLSSQMKFIAGGQHKDLIRCTGSAIARAAKADKQHVSLSDVLWGVRDPEESDENHRGRSLSPLGATGRRSSAGSVPAKASATGRKESGAGSGGRRSLLVDRMGASNLRSRSTSVSTRKGGGGVRAAAGRA